MITVAQLQSAIAERISTQLYQTPLKVTNKPLLESLNHVLATDITAPFELPRQPVSAMDGYALASGSSLDDGENFTVVGESVAGTPFEGMLSAGQAVRIMTGAVVPDSCDSVVMQENTTRTDDNICLTKTSYVGNNIRQQGEEITTGEVLIKAGTTLNPTHISLLANMGLAQVSTFSPIKVGLLASGDELKPVGEPLTSLSQIYNSNTPSLQVLLADTPFELTNYGIMPDELEQTKAMLTKATNECDVVISSAGVSVGDYDFLTTAINELGKINQYKVAMKPGKPFVFGELTKQDGTSTLYFGLPGNPLATFIGCLLIVKPALWQLAGATNPVSIKSIPATLNTPIKKRAGRRDFQRGIMIQKSDGTWEVAPIGAQDSHRVKSLSLANCLLDLTEEAGDLAMGETIQIIPFNWV